jgi:DNA-binding NarL/FixJ family response regulator
MATKNEAVDVFLFLEEGSPRKIFKEATQQAPIELILSIYYFTEVSKVLRRKRELPDIIFISCNLPCVQAKKCLQDIRKNETFDSIPIVIFSNSAYIEEINEVYSLGANLYVPKTVLTKERTKTMEAIFEDKWRKNLLRTSKSKFVLRENLDEFFHLTRHAS